MNIPLWIVLPVLTPLGVIAVALALQRLERTVLPPNRSAPVDVDRVVDGQLAGGLGVRRSTGIPDVDSG